MKNFDKFLLILAITLFLIGFIWAIVVTVQIWDLRLTSMERYRAGLYPSLVAISGALIGHYLIWKK